jgi:hypothetical protein
MEFSEDVVDRNQDGLTGRRKTQGNWVIGNGGRMSRIVVDGDICLRRPRPTQDCTADDDTFRHYRVILRKLVINTLPSYTSIANAAVGNTIYS